MLAPNAKLRRAVTETAGPAGATLQLLQEARQKMGIPDSEPADQPPLVTAAEPDQRRSAVRRAAARCWALLMARRRSED